ncbi:MAG: urease subunit beta [Muribaculaceae bacterium]|nr:urease subunit beta [Muribaculaceae bacterium]
MATDNNTNDYTTLQGIYPGKPQITYPNTPGFTPAEQVPVGGVILADGDLTYNDYRRTKTLKVRNTGDRPIQIGSHFHFFEVNRYMEFDRKAAFGYHLNIPATTAIRFEPGEEKEVEIVEFAGKHRIIGFNGLTKGFAGLEDTPTYYPREIRAFSCISKYGFKDIPEAEADAEFTTPAK